MTCFSIFVFNHKTAYEMLISDWSSDVCSSDLIVGFPQHGAELADDLQRLVDLHGAETIAAVIVEPMARSEERRVGNECVSTGRSRRAPYNSNKKVTIKQAHNTQL